MWEKKRNKLVRCDAPDSAVRLCVQNSILYMVVGCHIDLYDSTFSIYALNERIHIQYSTSRGAAKWNSIEIDRHRVA